MSVIQYHGNPNLKPYGVQIQYTADQIQEYIKCKEDPLYFIENYCKIISLDDGLVKFKLYPYQREFITALHENRKVICMLPRQMGKTICVAAYISWYIQFNDTKTVAVLANKGSAAREILARIQLIIENVPLWLQQGVVSWNKGSVELENGSQVFTGATSSSGIRGKSCVTGDTKVCLEENDNYYYTEISKLLNNSNFIKERESAIMSKKYTVYRNTNNINNKIYVGFHSISADDVVKERNENGSIFGDGYMGSGKLMMRALEKYGPENFTQELIGIFDTKEEAEDIEREIVNKDFTLREDTYNITLGGNVRIMYGENNPFYGQKHTKQSLEKIQETRKQNGLPTYQYKIYDKFGNILKGFNEVLKKFDYENTDMGEYTPYKTDGRLRKFFIAKLCVDGEIYFSDHKKQQEMEEFHNYIIENYTHERMEQNRKNSSDRIKKEMIGKEKSSEQKKKMSISRKVWIEQNKEQFLDQIIKTNKDPDKIKKTADKHRGMKRSDETKARISEAKKNKPAHNKNKFFAYDPQTKETRLFSTREEIPEHWVPGVYKEYSPKNKKSYTDGTTYRMFEPGKEPEGWYLQGRPKKRISK